MASDPTSFSTGSENEPFDIEKLFAEPISCGYLLSFCEFQFCIENARFVQEVERYKDRYTVNKAAWVDCPWSDKSWAVLDEEFELAKPVGSANLQGVSIAEILDKHRDKRASLRMAEMEEDLTRIWDRFLSNSAPLQICMPAKVASNTVKRLELLHIYGREVFGETLIDPVKTIRIDILPRFIASGLYVELMQRTEVLKSLPAGSLLNVHPPTDDSSSMEFKKLHGSEATVSMAEKYYTLQMGIDDRWAYNSFLAYLRNIISSENLLCARMIAIFRELLSKADVASSRRNISMAMRTQRIEALKKKKVTTADQEESVSVSFTSATVSLGVGKNAAALDEAAVNQAWHIYNFFLAPGSAFEVGISNSQRKDVCLYLAQPSISCFDRVERAVIGTLVEHFENFKKSSFFKDMIDRVNSIKSKPEGGVGGCFGLGIGSKK